MHIHKVINTFNIVFNTQKNLDTKGFFKVFDKKTAFAQMKFRLKEYNDYQLT